MIGDISFSDDKTGRVRWTAINTCDYRSSNSALSNWLEYLHSPREEPGLDIGLVIGYLDKTSEDLFNSLLCKFAVGTFK